MSKPYAANVDMKVFFALFFATVNVSKQQNSPPVFSIRRWERFLFLPSASARQSFVLVIINATIKQIFFLKKKCRFGENSRLSNDG